MKKINIKNKLFRKNTIKNLIIFFIISLTLILLDLLTKEFLFKFHGKNITGPTQYNFKIFGIRSQAHATTTFTDWFKFNISNSYLIIFGFLMSFFLIIWILITDKKSFVIALSILVAGILGNTIDRIINPYVRNIIYIPWKDKGTFNIADVIILIGSINFIIIAIYNIFKKTKTNERKE